jgi:hypothetical protein
MRNFITSALVLVSITGCSNNDSATSASELPIAGEYRREAMGGMASTVSASRYEHFDDTTQFADQIIGPEASSCREKNVSISSGQIAITAICPVVGIESKLKITGKYGKDFWSYHTAIETSAGVIDEEYRYSLVGKSS